MERKEAIEVIKKNWPDSSFTRLREALETLIPELKESEDERIRKWLIHYFKEVCDNVSEKEKKGIVAWLEKQGDLVKYYEDKLDRCACENFNKGYKKALEKQGNLMKALQISNAEIGELVEKNYYLKEQLEKQGNNMGISETTKKELEDNLNKALEKETPESCNEFLEKQGSKKETLKERNICDTCEDSNGCLIPCCAKLLEKQGEQKTAEFDDTNAKRMFIKALERVEEQNNKGYKLTDCDKNSWWEDFKAYTSCIVEQKPWSEEDEEIHRKCICAMRASACGFPEEEKFVEQVDNWLKSLKERYSWKPSDEQMEYLAKAITTLGDEGNCKTASILNDLRVELKKLRGEKA